MTVDAPTELWMLVYNTGEFVDAGDLEAFTRNGYLVYLSERAAKEGAMLQHEEREITCKPVRVK